MDFASLRRTLLSLQSGSGAFASIARRGNISLPDHNGLVTALVLREMEGFADAASAEAVNRALDFLEACESSSGMYSFWPADRAPSWAPCNPDECDSTAVIAAELLHFGRITAARARSIAFDVLPAFQAGTGEFLAWRTSGLIPNPFDIVLNTNVIAFLAQAGCRASPAYQNACRAIRDAIAACESHPNRVEQLMPYYPAGTELSFALENALRRGAAELLSAADTLQTFFISAPGKDTDILFATAGRHTAWSSGAVRIARRIRRGPQ